MGWLRIGTRFDSPSLRDAALPGAAEYARHFDGPSVYNIIDRRPVSITPTQALFLMNDPNGAADTAAALVRRLAAGDTELPAVLDRVFATTLQRPPTVAERELAVRFVAARREQTGQVAPADEIREFVHLILCSNEILYIE